MGIRLPFSKTYLGRVWLQSPTVMLRKVLVKVNMCLKASQRPEVLMSPTVMLRKVLVKVNMCLKASQRTEKLMRLTALKLQKVVLSVRQTPRQAEVHPSHLYRTTDCIGAH